MDQRILILSALKGRSLPKNYSIDDVVHEVMVSYFLQPGNDDVAETTKLYKHTEWTLSRLRRRPKTHVEKLDDYPSRKVPEELGLFSLPSLTSREKMVLCLRHEQEMTLKEIGDKLGVSDSRVGQILDEAYEKVKRSEAVKQLSSRDNIGKLSEARLSS